MVIIYCCWGGHFKKRTMRIEIYLAISFFLLVLFIYFPFFLSFLFLLSSFPSFVFFCQPLGGGSLHRPPQIRHWIYPAISFFLLVLVIYFSFFLSFLFLLSSFPSFVFFFQPLGDRPIAPLRSATGFTSQFHSFYLFCLFTFPFISLFFFSFPLFPIFYFFVSLWGGGAIAPIPPQIRHWVPPNILCWTAHSRSKIETTGRGAL